MSRQRKALCSILAACLLLALLHAPALAVITRVIHLKDVTDQSHTIFTAKVDKFDPAAPSMHLTVLTVLKGKAKKEGDKEFVDLNLWRRGVKNGREEDLYKRLGAGMTLVFFSQSDGSDKVMLGMQKAGQFRALVFGEGTWFQLATQPGTKDKNEAGVPNDIWELRHTEPYLRRMFKGTSAELQKVVKDHLDGKAEPAPYDASVPPGLGPEFQAKAK